MQQKKKPIKRANNGVAENRQWGWNFEDWLWQNDSSILVSKSNFCTAGKWLAVVSSFKIQQSLLSSSLQQRS